MVNSSILIFLLGIVTNFRDMCLHNDKVYLVSDEDHENHILQVKFKGKKLLKNKMVPTARKSNKQNQQKISPFLN